ncbi:hypothetical protein NQZ68_010623 [Dissostichus eleginoides]|nr:hypothetical protein NQZ68_010623 [Dissostichus eleginoides]
MTGHCPSHRVPSFLQMRSIQEATRGGTLLGGSEFTIDPLPLAGAAHRSERRRPLVSPTSSRCSAREREECK